jgi:hypothetical protein
MAGVFAALALAGSAGAATIAKPQVPFPGCQHEPLRSICQNTLKPLPNPPVEPCSEGGGASLCGVIDVFGNSSRRLPGDQGAEEQALGETDPQGDPTTSVAQLYDGKPHCKTTKNVGAYEMDGGYVVYKYTMEVYWCHGHWYIFESPSARWTGEPKGWFGTAYFSTDYHNDEQTYWYNYKNHGYHSGYALKRRIGVKDCDPVPPYFCAWKGWIELHTYLHGDGTVHKSQFYAK